MSARHISRAIFIVLMSGLVACVFEPAKRGYSQDHVKTTGEAAATPHQSLLVFRTSGYKAWVNQDAEFLVNGSPVAYFQAGGARYLPLQNGTNTIVVREPDSVLKCELEFEFEPGTGQFVEIYERFDPGAVLVSVILADMQSRALYNPHPESKCVGVFGLSMGKLEAERLADVHRKFSFQVVQR